VSPLARIAQLSAAFLCSNLARAGIGLALALVLGRGLGPSRFGVWILCTAWASTLTAIVDLGFGVLLTRDGARGDGDPAPLLAGALSLRLAAALPLACVLALAAGSLASDAESIAALRVAALLAAAGAAYGCFGSLLRSQPRWLPAVLAIETVWLMVQVGGSWWLVAWGRGVAALVALAAALQAAQIATALACWRTVFGARSPSPFARPLAAVPLLRRALPFAASGIVANLQGRIGPLMLGALATPADIGWFGAAARVGRGVKLAPQAIFAGALPVLAQEHGRDARSASATYRALHRGLAALSAAAAIACAAAAPFVMPLVFGRPFAAAAPTLVWMAVGLAPSVINSARKVYLYAAGAEAIAVRWSAVSLALQVIAGALLIPASGSAGAAIAIAIGEAAIWWPLRRAELAQVLMKSPIGDLPAAVDARGGADASSGHHAGRPAATSA
jgi:O-antigen/teichoic acid export membrane protein